MGLTHFPNGIASFGVPVIGAGGQIPTTTGSYFFVSSVVGASGNDGQSPTSAVATINQAVTKCTAAKGDVIILMPGHVEDVSVASGILINKSGITVVGIGQGSLRAKISHQAAAATVAVSAAGVTLDNIVFSASFADVSVAIIVTGKGITVKNCRFEQEAVDLNYLSCVQTSAGTNTEDGLKLLSNTRYEVDAASLATFSLLGDITDVVVSDNYISLGATTTGIGYGLIQGAFTVLGMQYVRNTLDLTSGLTTYSVGLHITGSGTSCTGVMAYNLLGTLDVTTPLMCTATLDYWMFENYYAGILQKNAVLLPVVS